MHFPSLALAVLASATPAVLAQTNIVPAYPLQQVLPLPGYQNTTESFNTLGNLYTSSASQLSSQATAIAQKTIALNGSGGITYSYDVKASLATALVVVNNLFWQTAFQSEQKICKIITSINEQNVDSVNGSLRAGIAAEVQAIVSITVTLTKIIAAIKAQLATFTEAERAVFVTLIQAIATAASASYTPLAALSDGLAAIGVTGISDVVGGTQVAVTSLQALTTVNFNTN